MSFLLPPVLAYTAKLSSDAKKRVGWSVLQFLSTVPPSGGIGYAIDRICNPSVVPSVLHVHLIHEHAEIRKV